MLLKSLKLDFDMYLPVVSVVQEVCMDHYVGRNAARTASASQISKTRVISMATASSDVRKPILGINVTHTYARLKIV